MTKNFSTLRQQYHQYICTDIVGFQKGEKIFNLADRNSEASIELAYGMIKRLNYPLCENPPEKEMADILFIRYTRQFLQEAFQQIHHLRPGDWSFSSVDTVRKNADCQKESFAEIKQILESYKELKAALGGDYLITPDIVVSRSPIEDIEINQNKTKGNKIISSNDNIAKLTPLRSANHQKSCEILHASISCKWTMRSDRAQNTRTEALNLLRNRKGRTPCILAVTFEPLPSRLASIALGTGDIDCTYHGALYELLAAAKESRHSDSLEMLQLLIDGRRLRDISDIPFDLAI